MQDIPPAIEVYPVHHLPIIKAYADQLGLVGLINHDVPTAMEVDAGTVVLGLVSNRSVVAVRCTAWKSLLPTKTPNCSWARLSLRTPSTTIRWGACSIPSTTWEP